MLFVVRFTDNPERLHIRKQFLPAHLEWLAQHRRSVLLAGSLRPEPEGMPVGACWIVEAQGKAAVEALLSTDPFWAQGLRQGVEILHFSKAFPEHPASI